MPNTPVRVAKGGTFMCNEMYYSGYKVSPRMAASPDTGLENTAFRCAADVK